MLLALSPDNGVPGELSALPSLITIHRVVTANHGSNNGVILGEFVLNLTEITLATGRRGVATISDSVNHHIFAAAFTGSFCQSYEMVLMAMHSPI